VRESAVWGIKTNPKGEKGFGNVQIQSENMRHRVCILLLEIMPLELEEDWNPALEFSK
jgi:hypothetical protein